MRNDVPGLNSLRFSKKQSVCGSYHPRFRFEVNPGFTECSVHARMEDRVTPKSLLWPDCPPWTGHFAGPSPVSDPGTRRPEGEPKATEARKHLEGGVSLLRPPCSCEGPAGEAAEMETCGPGPNEPLLADSELRSTSGFLGRALTPGSGSWRL